MSEIVCIDCNLTHDNEEQAKEEGWGWSYGPEGTLWVCPDCLSEREECDDE